MSSKPKETRFLDALESLFTGAEVDGNSGYINLMHIKHEYFKSVRETLMEKINERTSDGYIPYYDSHRNEYVRFRPDFIF